MQVSLARPVNLLQILLTASSLAVWVKLEQCFIPEIRNITSATANLQALLELGQ